MSRLRNGTGQLLEFPYQISLPTPNQALLSSYLTNTNFVKVLTFIQFWLSYKAAISCFT